MRAVMELLLLVVLAAGATSAEQLTLVQSKLDNLIYLYPNQLKRESELPECKNFEVCSTEHKRYWLPTWVHRYCRCPTSDCSESVSMLDNRSNIKVCKTEKDKLEACAERERGLEVSKLEGEREIVRLTCRCQSPKYWALAVHIENATISHDRYACVSMRTCKGAGEFCGHIRADTHSMYQQCACPREHICINNNRKERNVTEALFNGPAIRAYCLPYTGNDRYY